MHLQVTDERLKLKLETNYKFKIKTKQIIILKLTSRTRVWK